MHHVAKRKPRIWEVDILLEVSEALRLRTGQPRSLENGNASWLCEYRPTVNESCFQHVVVSGILTKLIRITEGQMCQVRIPITY